QPCVPGSARPRNLLFWYTIPPFSGYLPPIPCVRVARAVCGHDPHWERNAAVGYHYQLAEQRESLLARLKSRPRSGPTQIYSQRAPIRRLTELAREPGTVSSKARSLSLQHISRIFWEFRLPESEYGG